MWEITILNKKVVTMGNSQTREDLEGTARLLSFTDRLFVPLETGNFSRTLKVLSVGI